MKKNNHKLKPYPKIFQTLKFWDEEAGKFFHNICHKKKKSSFCFKAIFA